MKLISYLGRGGYRAAVVVQDHAVDLDQAAKGLDLGRLPTQLIDLLRGGPELLFLVERVVEKVTGRLGEIANGEQKRPSWIKHLHKVRLGPPIPNPEKIICIGLNYIDHCREQGVDPPKNPVLFSKFANTLSGPNDAIRLPGSDVSTKVDYEVELAFVIGQGPEPEIKRIGRAQAMEYVAGYMILNDVTARDIQKADGQWVRGKSLDSFAPCGPWLVTRDELPDPSNLPISLKLNGETMQDSSTSNLIFDIPYLIEYITRGITLKPGDIISTGTPPGVGIHRDPPVVLKAGDEVEAAIEGIGKLNNRCA